MSEPSAGTEPESPPAEGSSAEGASGGEESRGTGAQVMALIVGVLIGMGIGLGIGMGIGNAARKRIDYWSRRY